MNDLQEYMNIPSTGDHYSDDDKSRTITIPFGIYDITLKIDENGKLLSVTEIKANKDFMSYKQKLSHTGAHEVEDIYGDDEDES